MRNHILIATCGLFLTSCISVKVPFEASSKLDKVEFQAPSSPFAPLEADVADAAWISEKTGNTISFLSECKSQNEKPEDFALDSVKSIEKMKIVSKTTTEVGGQKAAEIIAAGFIDKVPVKMVVTTLHRNNCFINLSYGGLEKHFSEEIGFFQTFKTRFKAP